MALSLSKQLVLVVMQFLKEEKFEEVVHFLEQQSGLFFDLKYFESLMIAGEFQQVELYLMGFMNLNDDRNSVTIFFEIRKQKYLEALDRKDSSKALEILKNELKVFSEVCPKVYAQLLDLLVLDDFRENEELKNHSRDTKTQRAIVFRSIKKLLESNPLIQQKLTFPGMEHNRLRVLVNQSINYQHGNCKTPRSYPDVRNIFVDHTCVPRDGARTPSPANNPLMVTTPNGVVFPPNITTYSTFQPGVFPTVSSLTGWAVNHNLPVPPSAVASGSADVFSTPNTDALLKRPINPTPAKGGTDHHFADSEHIMKRFRVCKVDEDLNSAPTHSLNWQYLNSGPTHSHSMYPESDLPKTVVRCLNQGSNVVSMDFHPQNPTILLVGTDIGDIAIWEVVSREKLAHKPFRVWDYTKRRIAVQAPLSRDSTVSVNKCIWSPDGTHVGVAFYNEIIHMYHFSENGELRQHLQIDAHTGSVNDIAFANHNEQIYVITCGNDKTIKVWDAISGEIQYTFEGHETPVYSVCPHHKEDIQFILSTSVDGKIKTWFYDRPRSEISYEAPGNGCTTMAYSVDGLRLFSCGTSKGESYMVEWNDQEGIVKQAYSGLAKRSLEKVKFDTAKNKLLAAGDEHQIKFWDMDNINILSITKADGGLPARPNLRFNKDGSLLAVTTSDNGIKILANPDGIRFLQMLENRRVPQESVATKAPTVDLDAANAVGPVPDEPENSERVRPEALINGVHSNGMVDFKQRIPDDGANKSKKSTFTEVTDPVQCRSIRLPDPLPTGKIAKLQYVFLGSWLLALDTNGQHKLWKWQRDNSNPSGKATAKLAPELWKPANGIDMRNDISGRGRREVDPCMIVTKNSSYVMSCSGGMVSVFKTPTFQVMKQFGPCPATATSFAFHPKDSNITAIGMEDATIQIYNCRKDEIKWILKGHQKGITGLAFSEVLNVLVSSGADAQLCVWVINEWEKQKSTFVHSKEGRSPSSLADTRIQFHKDEVHLLVVQDSQIAIYDASKLECLCHWAPQDPMIARISSATYSCDSLLVYASFCDGSVCVFDAEDLKPRCRIAPSAFMLRISSGNTYPLVIAAHPHEPNQFALGMTDGGVLLIEPAESEGKWGTAPSDKGAATSNDTISK